MNLDEFKTWIEEKVEGYGEYLDKQQCGTLEWAYAYGCYESVSDRKSVV